MKRKTAQWVRKAESDFAVASLLYKAKQPHPDQLCFLCQQTAEKYLKALLQELALPIPRLHDLEDLLNRLIPQDATLGTLLRTVAALSRYAAEYRYPGRTATFRQAQVAFRRATRVREELRTRLGLKA